MTRNGVRAALILGLILNVVFLPALWGGKTLLMSAWDAPSIMPTGAYSTEASPSRIGRTPDPGAPAWQTEAWFKIVADQFWNEHRLPLWNPNSAYGTPLAAAMQPQPFFPLTILLSLHPSSWTYNFFIVGRLFVAGLLMFFFARFFLSFAPSLFAAVTFMLSGYFILYLNMPHLSVEVLLPGVFLAFELLLRENSWRAVVATAAITFLTFVGGMPESMFLAIAFGGLYFVFRLATAPELRRQPVSRMAKLAAGVALGFGLSAFLLLPFLEFIKISHDTHQASNVGGDVSGLAIDYDYRSTVMYLLPLIFGPVLNSILSGLSGWTGMRSYWGIVPCLFATAAIIGCFVRNNPAYSNTLRLLTGFFAVTLALMVLKRFGNPIINWIGHLPLSNMIVYVKYQEPLMAFCVAMLAGIGFSLLAGSRLKTVHFVTAAIVLLGIMLALAGWSLPRVLASPAFSFIYYLTVAAGVLLIAAAAALLLIPRLRPWMARGFFALLTAELFLSCLAPTFYLFNHLPSARRDPYAGAPYIDFLKQQDRDHYRLFARDGVLYPNWAGAFGLADVRDLDALYYRPYITFIRSFLLKPGDEARRNGDLADRFTGSGNGYAYAFDTLAERRFLMLSSIKYLIGTSDYGVSSKVLDEIVAQHRHENIWGFGSDLFLVGDRKTAPGLFQHPPSSRVTYKTTIDPKQPFFEGVAGIKPGAETKTPGVVFTLEIRADGKIDELFSTFLNPKDVPADRLGRPFRIDLSRYAGKPVELLFSTGNGPTNSNAFGWAGWARMRFAGTAEAEAAAQSPIRKLYDKEVNIHEVAGVLPRASLFRAVEMLPEDQVIGRLKDPAFDPETKVILTRESIAPSDIAAIEPFAKGSPTLHAAAPIVRYDSQRLRIETKTAAPSVLMLTDANYPGWRAYVNGSPAPVLKANYLFRAVIVPAGNNVVEFSYEPLSYRLGAVVSAATLVIMAVVGGLVVYRRRRAGTAALSH